MLAAVKAMLSMDSQTFIDYNGCFTDSELIAVFVETFNDLAFRLGVRALKTIPVVGEAAFNVDLSQCDADAGETDTGTTYMYLDWLHHLLLVAKKRGIAHQMMERVAPKPKPGPGMTRQKAMNNLLRRLQMVQDTGGKVQ
jgi:hypothetical protein